MSVHAPAARRVERRQEPFPLDTAPSEPLPLSGMHLNSRRTTALTCLCLGVLCSFSVLTGCSREEVPEEDVAPAPTKQTNRALRESAVISANAGAAHLTAAAQATVAVVDGLLSVQATGEDPQLTFSVVGAAGRPTAVYVDFETPAATALELFYQVENLPFSADHVIAAPTKAGRNQILLQVDDARFSGGFRLDPGQAAGEYSIREIVIFSDQPISFITPARPQEELAAAFDESADSVWVARDAATFGEFKPLQDVELSATPGGLAVKTTGPDPSVLLPEFDATQPVIVRLVITSPSGDRAAALLQSRGQTDHAQAYSHSHPLTAGPNTIYLEHNESGTTGPLRLDPGMAPGAYLLQEIDVRAAKAGTP